MVRAGVAAKREAQGPGAASDEPVPALPAAPDDDASAATGRPVRRHRKGPGARLWGFVRRHEDAKDKTIGSELLPQDIALWYDRRHNRFQVVADHKVIDDLAPVEFVQFVRALRFSATQILFKFENRHDGTAGRPLRVWSAPLHPGAA